MKLVFIIGSGRCGSTLVHEVLMRHEAFGFISNIEDNLTWTKHFDRWNNPLYRSWLGRYTEKGKLRFAPSEAYNIIAREVSPIYANSCRDLTSADVTPWLENRFQKFFQSCHHRQGRDMFSHKYTGWPRIGFFSSIFQEAKFINIVRDGRAVANSWLQMPWWNGYRGPDNWLWGELTEEEEELWRESNRQFNVLAALSWKKLMYAFEKSRKLINPDQYLEIRYEDVVKNPREAFEKILSFSDIDWTNAFNKQFVHQVFRTSRRRAFETDLTPLQLEQIERVIGSQLERYGYD